ncbi:MAG: hypothetical protein ABIO63_08950 [Casimicrobiaceae bacterium]
MINNLVSLLCNHSNCKTTPVTGTSRKAVKIAARKVGWKVKGLKVMFCPDHRAEEGYPTAAQRKADRLAKKEKTAVAKKVTKSATKVTKPVAKKPVTSKPVAKKFIKPVTSMGQPVTGMVAKSAKKNMLVRK